MKISIIIPLVFIVVYLSSCTNDEDYLGSGDLLTESRDIAAFTKVKSEGIFNINIRQGEIQSLELTSDDNIMDQIKTTVSNDELRIYLSEGSYRNISLEANIIVSSLNGLKNSGDGDIMVFDLINEGTIDIENSGSGNITINGSVNKIDLRNEGSGEFYGFDFISSNCDIEISGSGDCEVFCTNNLDVKINGSGSVYYKGSPSINTNISGTGEVRDEN